MFSHPPLGLDEEVMLHCGGPGAGPPENEPEDRAGLRISGRGGRGRGTLLSALSARWDLAPGQSPSCPGPGPGPLGVVGLGLWCGTHRDHDPSISFGAFEAIQSWATLKPTREASVNPQACLAHVSFSHLQSQEPGYLQVAQGGQILLWVLVVLWVPGGKVNARLEREKHCTMSLICGI